ncbi:uncharacterized protein RCO7_02229 [Rhynchosporium graminicola]|uniref:Uncharacterized protein n=1 Tax=Rhynchosporium graminicola TaxID=2792576 RepID=A0A1E1LHA3_9HELO|nr:uncharacterized protein RCO7_02229 [Rhynchosporium commune]
MSTLHDVIRKRKHELNNKHLPGGYVTQYTVLTIVLDGRELDLSNESSTSSVAAPMNLRERVAAKQPRQVDAFTQTCATENMCDQTATSKDAMRKELEEFKKELEKEAEERLQEQLKKHDQRHKKRLKDARANFRSILETSLQAIHVWIGNPPQPTTVRLPNKSAAEVLRYNTELRQEYLDLCTISLKNHRANLSKQYQERLDNIEKECREWLQTSSGIDSGAIVGVNRSISLARSFEGRLPNIAHDHEHIQTMITPEQIEAAKLECFNQMWERTQMDIEDGGMFVKREVVHLDPLFANGTEPRFSQTASMVEVPATLLPESQDRPRPKPSERQVLAALGIIERNNNSNNNRSPDTSPSGNASQAHDYVSQYYPTNQFTPINMPKTTPYAAQPAQRSYPTGPTLVSSDIWYGVQDRHLADSTTAPSVHKNAVPSMTNSADRRKARRQANRGAFTNRKENHPITGSLAVHQHTPQRLVPTLVAKPRRVDPYFKVEDETPNVRLPLDEISKLNITSGSRRSQNMVTNHSIHSNVNKSLHDADYDSNGDTEEDNDTVSFIPGEVKLQQQSATKKESVPEKSAIYHSNDGISRGLSDADHDSNEEEDYVPPPASPPQEKGKVDLGLASGPVSGKLEDASAHTYIDRSLYDADYESNEEDDYVPPSAPPQQVQPRMQSDVQSRSQTQHLASNVAADRKPASFSLITSINSHSRKAGRSSFETWVEVPQYERQQKQNQKQQGSQTNPHNQSSSDLPVLSHLPSNPSSPWINETFPKSFDDGRGAVVPENENEYVINEKRRDLENLGRNLILNLFSKYAADHENTGSLTALDLHYPDGGSRNANERLCATIKKRYAPVAEGKAGMRRDSSSKYYNSGRPEAKFDSSSESRAPKQIFQGNRDGDRNGQKRHVSLDHPDLKFGTDRPPFDTETHIDPHLDDRQRQQNPQELKLQALEYANSFSAREKAAADAASATDAILPASSGAIVNGDAGGVNDAQKARCDKKFKGKTVRQIMAMLESEGKERGRERKRDDVKTEDESGVAGMEMDVDGDAKRESGGHDEGDDEGEDDGTNKDSDDNSDGDGEAEVE